MYCVFQTNLCRSILIINLNLSQLHLKLWSKVIGSYLVEGLRVRLLRCTGCVITNIFMCLSSKIKSKVWHFLIRAWWKSYNKNIDKYPDPHPSFVSVSLFPKNSNEDTMWHFIIQTWWKSYKNIQKYTGPPFISFLNKVYSLAFSYLSFFCGCRYPWWKSWPQE